MLTRDIGVSDPCSVLDYMSTTRPPHGTDSAAGTIERLDRFADEHEAIDRQDTKYSPPSVACDKHGMCAKLPRPAAGGRTRLEPAIEREFDRLSSTYERMLDGIGIAVA